MILTLRVIAFGDMKFAKSRAIAVFAVSVLGAAPVPAPAQAYPAKAIRVVVPYTAGGGADQLARIFSHELNEAWKRPVIVDNRPGGAAAIGTEMAAKAAPDGYTLLFTASSPIVVNQSLYPKLGYDPVKVLTPIAFVAAVPLELVTHPSVPVKTVKDLIALARAQPDKLNYGSGGSGTPPHLTAELFKVLTGVKITHIPFKGSGPSVIAVVSGQVDLTFATMVLTQPQVQAKRLRALAVTTPKRSQLVPELPTMIEAGVPGFVSQQWYGIFAPAGLPPDIANQLHAESVRILGLPSMREKLSSSGAESSRLTLEQFTSFIHADVARWAKVIKLSGATAD